MTPPDALLAMRAALTSELQLALPALTVTQADAAAERALAAAGYLDLAGFVAASDAAAGAFRTELAAGPGLSPAAALLDADMASARLPVAAHPIHGALLP